MLHGTALTPATDRERLIRSADHALDTWMTLAPYVGFFRRKLRGSRAVEAADVPEDVITMNSRFALRDERTGDTVSYTLVYPEDEAKRDGKLSVLSREGMVLYGAKVGDRVRWTSPDGPRAATVTRLLYQPEAAGHHGL